ncbi:MAG: SDR family NAD(P)-dependent oxidoreductase [Ktedonobacteraceae bacterium]|nr:SDR family NAD(P)-dependent oxidoreductase [Ktedonobacteraceae bacterium]
MSELNGKVALVTGGGRGIGRAIALELAQAGCDVALLARTREQIEEVAATIQSSGRRSIAIAADASNTQQVQQAIAEVQIRLGPISILINNAAIVGPMGPTAEVDPDAWAQAIAINLTGPFWFIRACLPSMLKQGWGRIINISSGAAAAPGMPRGNAYATSKAGLEIMTVNLATEIADSGVTVNAVRPGIVDTAMQAHIRGLPAEQVGETIFKQFDTNYREGKLQDPTLPARLVVNLLSSTSTGEIISIYDARGQELLTHNA